MANIGFLLFGALGCVVSVQTLDRPRPSRLLRVVALAVMVIAFVVANQAVLDILAP